MWMYHVLLKNISFVEYTKIPCVDFLWPTNALKLVWLHGDLLFLYFKLFSSPSFLLLSQPKCDHSVQCRTLDTVLDTWVDYSGLRPGYQIVFVLSVEEFSVQRIKCRVIGSDFLLFCVWNELFAKVSIYPISKASSPNPSYTFFFNLVFKACRVF